MGTDTRLHAFLNSAVDGQSGWLPALVALVLIKEPAEALNNDVSRALCAVYPLPSRVKPEAA